MCTPAHPSFYYIKVRCKGVFNAWSCLRDTFDPWLYYVPPGKAYLPTDRMSILVIFSQTIHTNKSILVCLGGYIQYSTKKVKENVFKCLLQ